MRAGVLEQTTVDVMRALGLGERVAREGLVHAGINLTLGADLFRIDLQQLTGAAVTIYGQQEVMKDLYDAAQTREISVLFEATEVALHDFDGAHAFVTYSQNGRSHRVDCDFIAGCDGFHGVSRRSVPADALKIRQETYPFSWLGILVDVPPANDELIYASHDKGFALASMRSPTRSRYYMQCASDEDIGAWSDERFWDELRTRLGPVAAANITRGPSIEKSIASVRSFRAEPMRHGNLFLAGDAAHIVPPIGAKGLNLAVADVAVLADAFVEFYRNGSQRALDSYSERALARVRKADVFSRNFLEMTHRFPEGPSRAAQRVRLEQLFQSPEARREFARDYVGAPLS